MASGCEGWFRNKAGLAVGVVPVGEGRFACAEVRPDGSAHVLDHMGSAESGVAMQARLAEYAAEHGWTAADTLDAEAPTKPIRVRRRTMREVYGEVRKRVRRRRQRHG